MSSLGRHALFHYSKIPFGNGTVHANAGKRCAVANPAGYAAQTTFAATLPEPLQANETLAIAILDEVTGLSLNATQYPMSARDSLTYTATLPLPYNSVVKYRYVRRGTAQVLEDTNLGTPIRYRMYFVAGPAEVTGHRRRLGG